ncbi:uncharacterized protein LOC124818534 [Hydra vulgaris]|uniref:uncharacterized protein LOC124818534 n=1 Tax=Hydra vulgaris TaxID=6087 RepID=UPI001F5ECBBE|nr:uncharacterized protein LOC124818534 [Hydra vulgaris]
MPSEKSIRTTLLKNQYENYYNIGLKMISESPYFSISSDGKSIAEKILKFVEELESDKCVSIITDNTSSMRSAWNIIKCKFPKIFANGCAAHVINLLIKDIISLDYFKETMTYALQIVLFIKRIQLLSYRFNELKKQYRIQNTLVIPVDTRWYTHYNSLPKLMNAKFTIELLIEDHIMSNIKESEKKKSFMKIVSDSEFWKKVKNLSTILEFPSNIIGKFKSDNYDLANIYNDFKRLLCHFEKHDLESGIIVKLLYERWAFIHTESMGFAFVLSPIYASDDMIGSDKLDTLKQLKKYYTIFYDSEEEISLAIFELNEYLTQFVFMSDSTKEEIFKMSNFQYWAIVGKSKFSNLSKIAIRLFTVPTSSASSEGIWSMYNFIHGKRRNRLLNENVEKLAFLYINSSLLDKEDKQNYLCDESYIKDNDEEEMTLLSSFYDLT